MTAKPKSLTPWWDNHVVRTFRFASEAKASHYMS